jgi:predicted permease
MSFWKEWMRRLVYQRRRAHFDDELDDEIRFHLETRAAELEETGIPGALARAQARKEFGSTLRMREDTRAAWQFHWLEDLAADLRYAARAFRRNPGFALTAVFCLALGTGANIVIFSLTTAFLFSQPSCRNPETLRAIRISGSSAAPLSAWRFLRDAHVLDGLAGEVEESESNWRNGDDTSRLWPMQVTDNFFAVTGTPVAMGRPMRLGTHDEVVLTDRFWQGRLGADPGVLGKGLVLDGKLYTIVGVLPPDHHTLFGFGFSPDLYMPVSSDKAYVSLYARVPSGISKKEITDRLTVACHELDPVQPQAGNSKQSWATNIQVTSLTGMDRFQGDPMILSFAAFFALLTTVVGLVLLIACTNVASMLLARASSRSHELAVRLSIGASRGRIVRQLLAESFLLAMLGTAVGLCLNLAFGAFVSRFNPPIPIPIHLRPAPDWRLLAYALAIVFATTLIAGLIPALRATRTDANTALKQGAPQILARRWTLRNSLVAGQLAVSIVLLSAGFVFIENLVKAATVNPGFDLQHTVWAFMRLVPAKYQQREKIQLLASQGLDALRHLRGVESASVAKAVPLNFNITMSSSIKPDDAREATRAVYRYNCVGVDYFRTMGIPILRGRGFTSSDRRGAPAAVILNEALAHELFPIGDPIGHTIQTVDKEPRMVVGIARNSKYSTLTENNMPALYEPFQQDKNPRFDLQFMVRLPELNGSLLRTINKTLGTLDPAASVEVKAMKQALGLALLPSRAGAAILGSLGVLGMLLAAIGLYGALAFLIASRTREIGVRVALGATRVDVVRFVFSQSLPLAFAGTAIGLLGAIFAMKPLAFFLVPDVTPADPLIYLLVLGVFALVTGAATLGPAMRALRVEPIAALRYD